MPGCPWQGVVVQPVFAVTLSDTVVEGWSTIRLPFEPVGKLVGFRTALRAALRVLKSSPGGQLYAVYGATDADQFVDTENVLLYNVGIGTFRHLANRGIVFERAYHYPPPPESSGLPHDDTLHYHRYGLNVPAGLSHWQPTHPIAAFHDVDAVSLAKPATVWAAIRQQASPPPTITGPPQPFIVRLRIVDRRPAGGTNLAGLIKPTLDGIISAFHSHVGESEQVARRLDALAVGSYDDLHGTLADPAWGVLGPRTLIRPFGTRGVQWNPADERCVAASITLDEEPGIGPRWQLTGELLNATPR